MKDEILQQFSQCTIREIVEILNEVFGRRSKFDEKLQKYKRWFVVSYTGEMNDDYKGFIHDPGLSSTVEVLYLADPFITYYDNEDYFESGMCEMCGMLIICTHRDAICPYCFSSVGCT